jgi:hypothetical protein
MPELTAPVELTPVDLEQTRYLFEDVEDRAAIELVTRTFSEYERTRQSHEQRWQTADRLYHGWMTPRYWEGTTKARASLAVPIVYDQVEAAYPLITEALFDYYPAFFDVLPQAGATAADAAAIRDTFSAMLEAPFDESGLNSVAHMSMSVRQMELYGDGAVRLSWDFGQKRFIVEWVDIRDLYFDASTPGPCIDWSPSVIERQSMTVKQLSDIRGTAGVNIPPDATLNYLAKCRYAVQADQTRQIQASARGEQLDIGALRVDPQHQTVEVLIYTTAERIIWVLGRKWVAINQPNPYGFINYCKSPFTPILGRPYSMSLADALEGDQKYAQGIRNLRLDNLNLALCPPRKRIAGTMTSPAKLAWRPGMIDEVSDAQHSDVYRVENVTADAYREEQIIHSDAARRTGVNEFVQSGTPTPSNANRSATGVMQQAGSVSRRLRTAVKNFEDFIIVPMLYKALRMIRRFAPERLEVMNPKGEVISVERSTFERDVRFIMRAASRMIAKDRLAMMIGPVSQLLFNDVVTNIARQQGQTVDFGEFERFFHDATGTSKSYSFFREMTAQEQQAANQPDPKTMAQMQMAEMDRKTRLEIMDKKSSVETMKAQLQAAVDRDEIGEESARQILAILGAASGANDSGEEGDSGSGDRSGVSNGSKSSRTRKAA